MDFMIALFFASQFYLPISNSDTLEFFDSSEMTKQYLSKEVRDIDCMLKEAASDRINSIHRVWNLAATDT